MLKTKVFKDPRSGVGGQGRGRRGRWSGAEGGGGDAAETSASTPKAGTPRVKEPSDLSAFVLVRSIGDDVHAWKRAPTLKCLMRGLDEEFNHTKGARGSLTVTECHGSWQPRMAVMGGDVAMAIQGARAVWQHRG